MYIPKTLHQKSRLKFRLHTRKALETANGHMKRYSTACIHEYVRAYILLSKLQSIECALDVDFGLSDNVRRGSTVVASTLHSHRLPIAGSRACECGERGCGRESVILLSRHHSMFAADIKIYSQVTSKNLRPCNLCTHEAKVRTQELDSRKAPTATFRLQNTKIK